MMFAALTLCLIFAARLVDSCTVCGSHFNVERHRERWSETCHNNSKPRSPKDYLGSMNSTQRCEMWLLDQAYDDPKHRQHGGGILYIYDSAKLKSNPGQGAVTINLTTATLDAVRQHELFQNGSCKPGQKPHMISAYPHFADMKYAVISYVGSGDIQVMDVETKRIVGCINTRDKDKGGSVQNHYAEFTSDGQFIVVLDIGGPTGRSGHLHKIRVDHKTKAPNLVLIHESTLKLHTCIKDLQTKAARPICGGFDRRNGLFYVTMSQGGLLVVDVTKDEFKIVKVYSRSVVQGDGCGGSRRYSGDFGMVTNGASTGKYRVGDYLYFHNTSAPCEGYFPDPVELEIPKWKKDADLDYDSTPYGNVPLGDTHGTALCVNRDTGEEILLTTMRLSNEIVFVNVSSQKIVQRKSLARSDFLPNPTPDLLSLIAYGGDVMCMSLRGGIPLSAIGKFKDTYRRTPGMLCVRLTRDCLDFDFDQNDFYPTTEPLYPTPDPHAIFQVCYRNKEKSTGAES